MPLDSPIAASLLLDSLAAASLLLDSPTATSPHSVPPWARTIASSRCMLTFAEIRIIVAAEYFVQQSLHCKPAIPSITTAPYSPALAPYLTKHSSAHNATTSAD